MHTNMISPEQDQTWSGGSRGSKGGQGGVKWVRGGCGVSGGSCVSTLDQTWSALNMIKHDFWKCDRQKKTHCDTVDRLELYINRWFWSWIMTFTKWCPIFKGASMYIHEPFNILTILFGGCLPYVSIFKQLSLITVTVLRWQTGLTCTRDYYSKCHLWL